MFEVFTVRFHEFRNVKGDKKGRTYLCALILKLSKVKSEQVQSIKKKSSKKIVQKIRKTRI